MSDITIEQRAKQQEIKEQPSERELREALRKFSSKERKALAQSLDQSPEFQQTVKNIVQDIVHEQLKNTETVDENTVFVLQLYRRFVDGKADTVIDGKTGPQTQEYLSVLKYQKIYPALDWKYLQENISALEKANLQCQEIYRTIDKFQYPELKKINTQIDWNVLRKNLVEGNATLYNALLQQVEKAKTIDSRYIKTVAVTNTIQGLNSKIQQQEKEKIRLSETLSGLQSRVGSDLNDLSRWNFSSADDKKADKTFSELKNVISSLDVINNQIFSLEKNAESQKIQ